MSECCFCFRRFLFELVIRVGAQKWKYCSAEDWQWKCLDVFVVPTSLWEVAVDVITAIFEGPHGIVGTSLVFQTLQI